MSLDRELDLHLTRRQLFGLTARGIGVAALGTLLGARTAAAAQSSPRAPDPKTGGLAGLPHFAPKAKRVIYLHQSGGPSQLETFDYKPKLAQYQGTRFPTRCAGPARHADDGPIAAPGRALGVHVRAARQAGTWVSELLPHTAKIVDDIASSSRCTPRRSTTTRRSPSSRPASSSPAGPAWAPG